MCSYNPQFISSAKIVITKFELEYPNSDCSNSDYMLLEIHLIILLLSVRGQYMSIFFCMLKGEYDSLLAWPFSLPITFSLICQAEEAEDRVDQVITFTPNPVIENKSFLGRPLNCRNPSLGVYRIDYNILYFGFRFFLLRFRVFGRSNGIVKGWRSLKNKTFATWIKMYTNLQKYKLYCFSQ